MSTTRPTPRAGGPDSGGFFLDPVCGMIVAGDALEVEGEHRYRFCSEHCREAFAADPAAYPERGRASNRPVQGRLHASHAGAGQEATIVVEGGYTPDTIRVRAGHPVRLTFERRESDPCSERVVLDAFGISADLPRGRRVPVEFTPAEPGIYEFACQMGMLRGRIVAT